MKSFCWIYFIFIFRDSVDGEVELEVNADADVDVHVHVSRSLDVDKSRIFSLVKKRLPFFFLNRGQGTTCGVNGLRKKDERLRKLSKEKEPAKKSPPSIRARKTFEQPFKSMLATNTTLKRDRLI